MADCIPKQPNDCVKSGIGPNCSGDDKGGAIAKRLCLERAKEGCEPKLKRCIDECGNVQVNLYMSEKLAREKKEEDEKKKRDEANAAKAKAQSDCQKNSDGWYKSEFWWRNESFHSAKYCVEKRRREIGTGGPGAFDTAAMLESPTGATIYISQTLANYSDAQLDGECKGHVEREATFRNQMEDFCPSPDAEKQPELDPKDVCRVHGDIRRHNTDLSQCVSRCFQQAASDCRTVQCYCGLYKCPGPDQERFGRGAGPEEKVETKSDFKPGQLSLTLSSWGIPIELVYTRHYMPGNIIWIGDVAEIRTFNTTVVLDSSGVYTKVRKLNIDNYLDFHVALCAGELEGISRIWLDQNLVYDKSGATPVELTGQDRMQIRTLLGTESQKVIRDAALKEGFGRVPAYRGTAAIYIDDMNISTTKAFPKIKVEVLKKVDQDPVYESVEVVDLDPALFRVDVAARRVLVKTATGFKAYNYDTLAEVRTVDIADLAEITELPSVVRSVSGSLQMAEIGLGNDIHDPRVLAHDADVMFVSDWTDTFNQNAKVLVTSANDGTLAMYQYFDMTGEIKEQYPVSLTDLAGPVKAFVNAVTVERESTTTIEHLVMNSFFFAEDGDDISVLRYVQFSTNTNDYFYMEDEEPYTYTIEAADFGGTDPVTILGVHANENDNTLILFLDAGTYRVVKWTPQDGVIWNIEADSLPNFGLYPTGRSSEIAQFYFIGEDGALYVLDTVQASILPVPMVGFPVIHPTQQAQYYDPQISAVTYLSEDDEIVHLFYDRITKQKETLADVARDLILRSGADVGLVTFGEFENVEVNGYRTGTFDTAREILDDLMTIYPSVAYNTDRLTFRMKNEDTVTQIDEDDMEDPFKYTRDLAAYEVRSSILNYYSEETEGERAAQSFSLPDDIRETRTQLSVNSNVLEFDDYMRRIAELNTFRAIEADSTADMKLGWKYLALGATDIAFVRQGYRVKQESIGADGTMQFRLELDNTAKYQELIDITGTQGYARFDQTVPITGIPYPLTFPARCIMAEALLGWCTYFGASNLLTEFTDPATISDSSNMLSESTGSEVTELPAKLSWGRVTELPEDTAAEFTTQFDGVLKIRFEEAEMAAAVAEPKWPVETIDTLMYAPLTQLLLVGQEWIQYRDCVLDPADMTGHTVIFSVLNRARYMTERFMETHRLYEPAFFYDPNALDKFPRYLSAAFDDRPTKAASTGGLGVIRRMDQFTDAPVVEPLAARNTFRQDSDGSGSPSSSFPDNPHVFISTSYRIQNAMPFLDHAISMPTFAEPDWTLYLLREDYDPVTFEAERNGFSTDYIMLRAAEPEAILDDDFNIVDYGVLWLAEDHDLAEWDAATEPLVAVVVVPSDHGETITATKFTPGDYIRFGSRGIPNGGL